MLWALPRSRRRAGPAFAWWLLLTQGDVGERLGESQWCRAVMSRVIDLDAMVPVGLGAGVQEPLPDRIDEPTG